MSFQQITNYLDKLPGVLALWWFMENINDDHPERQEIFFYLRERVRRYHYQPDRVDQHDSYKIELGYDAELFKRMEN